MPRLVCHSAHHIILISSLPRSLTFPQAARMCWQATGMGFPVGLVLPKQLLHLLLLLGHIRRCLLWAFNAVGLGDLLDLGEDTRHLPLREHGHGPAAQHRPMPAIVIDEVLPVVRFDELESAASSPCVVGGDCAVCLSGFDKVRRVSNCRHVFHRGCLDRWMKHDQRTCPLCRAPLIPDDTAAGVLWATDASDLDFFSEENVQFG